MYNPLYVQQVKLLLQCLPAIRAQKYFALKGGTAINLFVRDLPRLSVDIDLKYLHFLDRESSINQIQEGLTEIADTIKKQVPQCIIKKQMNQQDGYVLKLLIYAQNVMVKIEPNFVMRGTLLPIVEGNLCEKINSEFSASLDKVPMLAVPELYAGKLCAALSRQHPRDLFDVKLLFENEGITEIMRQAFVVYAACSPRPMHELLSPNLLDFSGLFEREFAQMTANKIEMSELIAVRSQLIEYCKKSLTDSEKQFLISVKEGRPIYDLLPFKSLNKLPSLQWKLLNIQKMEKNKHKVMLHKLRSVLEG